MWFSLNVINNSIHNLYSVSHSYQSQSGLHNFMINICAYYPEQEIKTFQAMVYLQLEIAILNRGKLHINTSRLSLSLLLPERIGNLKPNVVKADSSSSRMEEKPSQPSLTLTLSAPLNIFIVSPLVLEAVLVRLGRASDICVHSHDARCWLFLMLVPFTDSHGIIQMLCWLQP